MLRYGKARGARRANYRRDPFGGGRSSYRTRPSAPRPNKPPTWSKGVNTKVDAKKKFRAEALKHHPDRGGSTAKMQELNTEWSAFKSSPAFSKLASAFFDEFDKIMNVRLAK